MLCWFGIDAGVCVATAQDDDLIQWKKHPKNPVIPITKEGSPGWGVYGVWDPYMWFEGDTYYCLLGGNSLPNKKDTLYLLKSADLVNWTPLHSFYEHPDLTWTVDGEDCSCPDFFKLGDDKWGLMCISHKMGARCYIGRYENEKFYPEQHIRMNWPGGQFFAPESLQDDKGRRIFWAWVSDPRIRPSQVKTGSGFQSLPRVLSLDKDGGVHITPAPELETLRRNVRQMENLPVPAGSEITLDRVQGDCLEIDVEIELNGAKQAGLMVRCSPDGKEGTAIWYDAEAQKLKVDVTHSTLRTDVFYGETIFTGYNANEQSVNEKPVYVVEAPLALAPGEPLKLRVFLDKPMLEVFANDRQCITQMVYPESTQALLAKACAKGGDAVIKSLQAWDMAPAKFTQDASGA